MNPQTGVLSGAYEKFVDPIYNGVRGGNYECENPDDVADIQIRRRF